jgi:hypothetical protein
LIISLQDGEKLSREQIRAFLEASEEVHFRGKGRKEVYERVTRLLRRQEYRKQGKVVRGLLRKYMGKMTGQVTQLILEREWTLYRHAEYQQLATISVAPIYNLRKRQ